jgi:hypothetical protein
VQPIESDGEFQITGLRAHTIWEYIEDRLSFAVNSGTIDLNATYKFALKDAVDLQATVSKIAVNDACAGSLKGIAAATPHFNAPLRSRRSHSVQGVRGHLPATR